MSPRRRTLHPFADGAVAGRLRLPAQTPAQTLRRIGGPDLLTRRVLNLGETEAGENPDIDPSHVELEPPTSEPC